MLRSWRTWGCLALGAALWLELGAVRGATQWQVTATGYVKKVGHKLEFTALKIKLKED